MTPCPYCGLFHESDLEVRACIDPDGLDADQERDEEDRWYESYVEEDA